MPEKVTLAELMAEGSADTPDYDEAFKMFREFFEALGPICAYRLYDDLRYVPRGRYALSANFIGMLGAYLDEMIENIPKYDPWRSETD